MGWRCGGACGGTPTPQKGSGGPGGPLWAWGRPEPPRVGALWCKKPKHCASRDWVDTAHPWRPQEVRNLALNEAQQSEETETQRGWVPGRITQPSVEARARNWELRAP